MDAIDKAAKFSGEIRMAENKNPPSDVVVMISGDERDSKNPVGQPRSTVDLPSVSQIPKTLHVTDSSPEIARYTTNSSPNKPPKIPTTKILTWQNLFASSAFSKPKSRFGGPSLPTDANMLMNKRSQVQFLSKMAVPKFSTSHVS